MVYIIILVLLLLLIVSFVLALRALARLEIPQEIVAKVKRGEKTPVIWGVILFLKGKTVHYTSSSSESLCPETPEPSSEWGSSSSNPSKISERIEA